MIKKVTNHSGLGKVYLPKEWLGRLVSISLLTKREEKEYLKKEKEYLKSIEDREKKLKKHIMKLKGLRNSP